MISFENTEVAFKGKTNRDLKRAYWLFKLVGNKGVVKFGKWGTKFALRTRLPIKGIIKKTIFKQFCGGESIDESLRCSEDLAKNNVKTILDYSIEGKTAEEDFDATVQEIIRTIQHAKSNKNIPFAVFKVTGICLFDLLEKANDGLNQLGEIEKADYQKLTERVDSICQAAFTNDVPVFIDAEESWIQNSIDHLAYTMSLKYNQSKAIVYNTLQMYRHDRLSFFENEISRAKSEKWFLGVKIVRGAYMEKERERAKKNNYTSPIQPDKNATDNDFNRALKLACEHIDIVSICAGTHNEDSALKLVTLMEQSGLKSTDERVYFAQLLGMSDHISFNLADKGYMVAKYVPYGPIKEVLPYLIRRAEENTSVAGQTGRELSLIMREIKRRKLN